MKKFEVDPKEQIEMEVKHHSQPEKRATTAKKTHKRKEHMQVIKKYLPNAKKMLCIGCRDDSEVRDFINFGYKATGIDLSNNTKLIKQMDAHEIKDKFSEKQFDIVYSSHSLEHMYDADKVMAAIRHTTKKGIYIILPEGGERKGSDPATPSVNHPSIFDIMNAKCNNVKDVLARPELLNDFKPLGKVELMYFLRAKTEIHILFKFIE